MAKLGNISVETRQFADKYINSVIQQSVFSEPARELIVSLYALTENARPEICDILRNDYIKDLSKFLSMEEVNALLSDYSNVVKYCYNFDISNRFVKKDAFLNNAPQDVVDLCVALTTPEEGSSIYLPYASLCQFAPMQSEAKYEGFEQSYTIWALSQILMDAFGIDANISCCDSEAGLSSAKTYDYIFACPPMLYDKKQQCEETKYLIESCLNENGSLCMLLPATFMYGRDWASLREVVISKAYNVAVLSMPQMLAPYSNVNSCILCVQKKREGKILLADIAKEEFFAKQKSYDRYETELKIQMILETIEKQDEQYVWYGSASQLLKENDFYAPHYLVQRYVPEAKSDERIVTLGELINVLPIERKPTIATNGGSDDKMVKTYRTLSFKDLHTNYHTCEVVANNLPTHVGNKRRYITNDALVVGFIGGKIKIGKLKDVTSSVSLNKDMYPFEITSNDVTEDFMLRSIMLDDTEKQAAMYATGMTISHLSIEDFLNIKVALPSLNIQERLCSKDAKAYLTEADRAIIETHEEFRKDMHMKKHAIGQTIFNLNNWWKVLQKARKEGNGIVDDNAVVGKAKPISVSEVYENFENAIKKLQQQIGKFDRGNGLQVEKFALTTFIEDYIKTHQSPLFSFVYDSSLHHSSQDIPVVVFDEDDQPIAVDMDNLVIQEDEPIEYVTFAPEALTIIFDNIVSNACSHGFIGRETDNVIKIDLLTEGDKFVVTIANNGLPINKQLSTNDVFTYGKTSQNGNNHYGIGGYEVSKLMREFNGNAELVLTPEDEFTVCYRLTFNDTNIAGSL